MATKFKKSLQKLIHQEAPEWFNEHLVRLGNYEGVVQTGSPSRYYAREYNGKVIIVHNGTANVPPTFDLHVRIGRKKSLPNIWQIIQIQEDYDSPAAGGQMAYHHEQHEFPAGDTVWVDRKQIKPLTVLVSDPDNFIVQVYGSVVNMPGGIRQIDTQTINLSSYVVATGAKFISIEADEDGVLSVHEGAPFAAAILATYDKVPSPDAGKYLLAFALMYEGQTALSNDDIRVPMPLGFNAAGYLTGVDWGDIGGDITDQIDLQAELDLKLEDAPEDGSQYARQDGAWAVVTIPQGRALQLVMMPGVSSPPVPVETPDGEDWVYYEVDL